MEKIVECIPNFSEGRDADKIELLLSAIASVPGVVVLDGEMDGDHHRSVITMAGEPSAIIEAAVRAASTAVELIDLNHHVGAHPRIGALDVLPIVPIKGVTMEECVEISRVVGKRIADELNIPVYLYEHSATRPDRVDLANIRRGEFEKLRDEIETDPERAPDFGRPRIHPTAGATAIGARFPLIAYNINLATDDLSIAKKIAKAVRGRDGGLRYVKALGMELKNRRQAQVSMNLVNYEATPIFRVFEMVKREAERYGVAIAGSEIIGLVPQAALNAGAEYYLRIENFSPDLILENRLQAELAKLEGPGRSVDGPPEIPTGRLLHPVSNEPKTLSLDDFAEEVASATPTLAGGSVAAYAGALAAALGTMVCNVTIGQKPALAEDLTRVLDQLEQLSADLRLAVREEAEGRVSVLDAIALPRESDAERLARNTAIEEATKNAIAVPLRVVECSRETLELLLELTEMETTIALTDLTVGAQLASAALRGSASTVLSQLLMSNDEEFNQSRRQELKESMARGQDIVELIEKLFFTAYPV